jgi:tetratricopeptide (TPR) repeat protein
MRRLICAVLFAPLFACSAAPRSSSEPSATPTSAHTEGPAAPVTFIEDDYARAEKTAKEQGKLVFVDVWAPWCHTCLSMKHGVLDSPEVGRHAKPFVFVSLDGDKDENVEFLARVPLKAWPTFFVLDPTSKSVVAMYGGSLSVAELGAFLDGAASAHAGTGAEAELAKTLVSAHDAFAAKDYAGAARLYDAASKKPWSRRNEALIGAMRALSTAHDTPGCGAFGIAHLSDVTGASSQADFVDALRGCAESSTDIDAKKHIEDVTLERLRALAASFPEGASVDDRADLLAMLADAETSAGHASAARGAHEKRIAILEEAAQKAGSPEGARVFDYERMGSYLALGRGDEAVKLFEGRVKDFPDSYEAWARLASTLHTLGRDKDALPAVDKAVTLAYGPRRLRYMGLRADIQAGLGNLDGAVMTLEEELRRAKELPPGQYDEARVKEAENALDKAKQARDTTRGR